MLSDVNYIKSEVVLLIIAVFIVLILSCKRKQKVLAEWYILGILTILGFLLAVFDIIIEWRWGERLIFEKKLSADSFGDYLAVLIYLGGLITVMSATSFMKKMGLMICEFYLLVIITCVAGTMMIRANDLVVLVVSLELLSISLYGLISMQKRDVRGIESAVKYFIIGSAATVIMLYGIVLISGITNSTELSDINKKIVGRGYYYIGVAFLLVGMLFKGGVAPFHIWKPDVYEGALINVTGFMSVVVKIAVVGSIIRLFVKSFAGFELGEILIILSIVTMCVGNFGALRQTNIKRMMAYSSIAHIGYILVGVCAFDYLMRVDVEQAAEALKSVIFYLIVYLFMNLGVFLTLMAISKEKESEMITDCYGLLKNGGVLGVMMLIFLLSLIGFPPTAGFFAKFGIFKSAFDAGLVWLVVIALINTVVSAYYYLKIVVVMLMGTTEIKEFDEVSLMPVGIYFSLWLCAGVVIILGVMSSGWTDTAIKSVRILIEGQ